jgi:FkbM family methyltransferase
MVKLFRQLIGPEDIVADIGANIGLTAILFSDLAHHVFAFEPSPSTFDLLTENLKRASTSNTDAINLGFGNKSESLKITFARNNRSGGFVSDKVRPERFHVTEDIQIDMLDHYFANNLAPPSFLKIDVEGFEQNVIKGGGEFLRAHQPTVVLEMNHFCLNVLQRITIPEFLDFMRNTFPYLYAIDADNLTIVDLHDPDDAYMVMHEHVVNHRFPNLVGGFDASIKERLDALRETAVYPTPPLARPAGKLVVDSFPLTANAGDIFEIPVTLINEGEETWFSYGTYPVLLSYHWQHSDGKYLVFDGIRTELNCKIVPPGKSESETVNVVAPSKIGKFNLVVTVVQEGIFWFEDQGFKCVSGIVSVV